MADPQILGGRYQLEAAIGDGGMARVYRARDTRLSRTVAIKVLREQFAGEPQFVERFMQEARLAAGLTHPQIVGVYDVGSDDDLHYIVMEYVAGDNLRQLIARQAPLPLDVVLPIIRQLADALDYAHGRGIVHRDIKPENILLTDNGEVKVGDFGIARALASTGRTATGTVLGSVSYFSPEQASGYPATPESDLYSLGIILFELLTRQVPFAGSSPVAVAMAQVNDPPPSLRAFRPDLPAAVEGVVLKAIAKNPPVRYHSGQDLYAALERAAHGTRQQGQRTAAAAASAPTMINPVLAAHAPRAQKPTRGTGGALAALVTTAALLIAAVLVARGLTSGDQNAAPPQPTGTATLTAHSGTVLPQVTSTSALMPPTATPLPASATPAQAVPTATTRPVSSPVGSGASPVSSPAASSTATRSAIFATSTPQPGPTAVNTVAGPGNGGSPPPAPVTPPTHPTRKAPTVPPLRRAATQPAGPMHVDLVTATGVHGLDAVGPSSTFSVSTNAVYAVATVHNKPRGVGLHFVWTYPNGKTFAYDNPYVAPYTDTTGYAELFLEGPGTYRVTVSAAGHMLASTTFTVTPDHGAKTGKKG